MLLFACSLGSRRPLASSQPKLRPKNSGVGTIKEKQENLFRNKEEELAAKQKEQEAKDVRKAAAAAVRCVLAPTAVPCVLMVCWECCSGDLLVRAVLPVVVLGALCSSGNWKKEKKVQRVYKTAAELTAERMQVRELAEHP